ncbi:hypothetical protein GOACH_23_00870 [Gordonia aichiensis NBRC 108223]|uniref:Uncharacterized protein n=1 Tax=Gordonia aichiensis NBRC 108223 TaxID=1220583 RepID=L7KQY9_9ACTN|nr:hypothetical protein GOACH_23_00870 [Gordonia aichiensis NBRC 108223]
MPVGCVVGGNLQDVFGLGAIWHSGENYWASIGAEGRKPDGWIGHLSRYFFNDAHGRTDSMSRDPVTARAQHGGGKPHMAAV